MSILHPAAIAVHSERADKLAWLHDADGNDLDSYPGPGWDGHDSYVPSPDEAAEWAGLAPQRGYWVEGEPDPTDLRANTLSDLQFFNEYLFPGDDDAEEGGRW